MATAVQRLITRSYLVCMDGHNFSSVIQTTEVYERSAALSYVVFNPATKQYKLIDLDGHQPVKLALVFDPWKSEHYKLIMETIATPRFFVYDSATHKWNGGQDSPFKGLAIFGAILNNLIVYATRRRSERSSESLRIPETEAYDTYLFDSNGHLNFLQLKPLHEENKFCFHIGVTIDDDIYKWEICKNAIVDFGSRSTVELHGMIRERRVEDSAFLFQVVNQKFKSRLLIYKFSDDDQGMEVMVYYEEDQLQFEYAHPFIHTFASV